MGNVGGRKEGNQSDSKIWRSKAGRITGTKRWEVSVKAMPNITKDVGTK